MASFLEMTGSVFHHMFAVREWFVLHLLLVYIFIASGIIINCIQLLTYLVVRPFSLSLFRNVNICLAWFHWSQLTVLAEWWSGTDCQLVVEEGEDLSVIGKEHAIIIMNHKYDIDWLMGWIIAERHGVLGSSKVYAKNSLKYVPLVGTTWWFTESIFLKRNLSDDKRTMEQSHAALQTYPSPFWMLLFCEGTRFTETKHQLSMEVARKKGMPELKHHLLPRPKGFCMALNGFKDKIDYVYDCTVCVPEGGAAPTLKNILYGRRCYAEMLVRRIPLTEVPQESDEATGQWLQSLYREKDNFFESFMENGKFVKEEDVSGNRRRLCNVKTQRRLQPLINHIFWAVLTVPPLISYIITLLASGSPYVIGSVLVSVLLLYVGRRLLLGITQIEKGSNFGLKSNAPAAAKKLT